MTGIEDLFAARFKTALWSTISIEYGIEDESTGRFEILQPAYAHPG